MLPLMIIGGVIGAVVSAVQGGSWLSDQINSAQSSASAGGKGEATSQADAKATPFEATLAAQTAGQGVPTTAAPAVPAAAPVPSAALLQTSHGTDYAALARMQAGIAAYSHVGEHHGKHTGATPAPGAIGAI